MKIVPALSALLCCAAVAPSAQAAISFSRTDVPGGQSPRAVAAADLNRDGKPDLVTANIETSEVSVLLGNGDGSFRDPVAFRTGGSPAALAVVDADADGKLDVAVADSSRGVVDVLLGNGDGTFRLPAATYPVGANPRAIVATDLTGDGVPDLATADSGSDTISRLVNAGDGTFGSAQTTSTGAAPTSLAAAALDGDTRPDLVFARPLSDEVGVLLGNDSSPGGFGPETDLPTGVEPRWVGVADLDADGKRDVVTAVSGADHLGVLLGNGDGTLRPATAYPVGQRPVSGGSPTSTTTASSTSWSSTRRAARSACCPATATGRWGPRPRGRSAPIPPVSRSRISTATASWTP